MTWKSPFSLTSKQIENVKRLIVVYSVILDAVKPMVKSDTTPSEVLKYLEGRGAMYGVCNLSEELNIRLPEDMSYYFKNRVVPYSAHWCKTPEQIFYQADDLGIHLSDVKMYMYKALEIRFNNLNEALILSAK